MAWKAGAQKIGENSALIHGAEIDGLHTSSAGAHGMMDANLLVRVLKTPLMWVDPAGHRFANEELVYDTVYWSNKRTSILPTIVSRKSVPFEGDLLGEEAHR